MLIRASSLQSGNDAYDDIVDAFDEIVDLVHSDNGVPIIVFNEQSILMLRMTQSLIPMWNELEANQ